MAQQYTQVPADDAREYYAVLNISPDASDEDVRRAYRSLAQAYHPDKHIDPEQKERAQEAFARLQEAYEVLADPNLRQIYDVYGKEGLAAGFQVGEKLDSLEDLKKKWEEFRKKQEDERSDQLSNHRGFYQCRVDASDLRAGLRFLVPGLEPRKRPAGPFGAADFRPLFRSITVQNSIDTPVGESDVFYMQGHASMRNNAGGGNLVCGYRRVLSPHDTLEGTAVLGFRSILSLTSTRQVTPYTTASLTTTYTAGSGVGMQLSSSRHLPYNMQATITWVVGPAPVSGLSFNITKRGRKYVAGGKLEVGAVTSLSGRVGYQVTPATTLRAAVRLGTAGMDLELGAGRKWNSSTSGYMGTVVGLQGVTFKGRLVRGGQTFEIPVLLSPDYSDWRLVAAAYVLPPLTYVAVSRCIVRPIVRWQRRRKEQREQREHAAAIRASLHKANAERALIEPVARRKARSEAAKRTAGAAAAGGGLIILDAVYGKVESYLAEAGPQQAAIAAAAAGPSSSSDVASATTTTASDAAAAAAAAGPATAAANVAPAPAPEEGQGQQEKEEEKKEEEEEDVPPPWLSVTSALQYRVTDSKLTLHPGVAKMNQLGFADPTPGGAAAERSLYVAYLYGSTVYEVTVDDMGGLQLPGAGEAVTDGGKRRGLLALGAEALGVPELLQA